MIRTLLFVLLGLVLTACAPGPVRQGPPPQEPEDLPHSEKETHHG